MKFDAEHRTDLLQSPLPPQFAMRPSSQPARLNPTAGHHSFPRTQSIIPSKMEALEVLGGYPNKPSNPRSRMVRVLLSMTVVMGCLLMLHSFLKIAMSRKPQDFYSFEVKDAKGKSVSLERYRGKVSPHQQNSTSRLTLCTVKVSQFILKVDYCF